MARLLRASNVWLLAAACASCGLYPKKLTQNDCETFGDRIVELTKKDEEVERRCGAKRSAELRKEDEQELLDLRAEMVRGCLEAVGRSYAPRDAQCVLDAKTPTALRACSFTTDFFYPITAYSLAAEKLLDARCRIATKEPSPPSKADGKSADDEPPKKPPPPPPPEKKPDEEPAPAKKPPEKKPDPEPPVAKKKWEPKKK